MNEQEALAQMVAPGDRRPGKMMGGIIQIMITRACDKACLHCTQGSNLAGPPRPMSLTHFENALRSLENYFGVVGVFGGNPALHPQFEALCALLRAYVPYERRGIWCDHPRGHGRTMRDTFNPHHSNLNCHMDQVAYDEFKRDWPEAHVFGLKQDSRHGPCFVAMKDVVQDEARRWELISNCDINKHWSALIGTFRGELRAWFCEIAGAQSMLHQDEPDYPDTGVDPTIEWELHVKPGERLETTICRWWQLSMFSPHFKRQVNKHCHECGVPLRGSGGLAMDPQAIEQFSATHVGVMTPKQRLRRTELVLASEQLGPTLVSATDYLGNAKRVPGDVTT